MWHHGWHHSDGLWPQHHQWQTHNLWVLPGLVFLANAKVVSNRDIVSWVEFVSALPPAKIPKDTDAAAKAEAAPLHPRSVLRAQHPWAMQYLDDGMHVLKKQRVQGGGAVVQDMLTQMTRQQERTSNQLCPSQRNMWMKSLVPCLKPEARWHQTTQDHSVSCPWVVSGQPSTRARSRAPGVQRLAQPAARIGANRSWGQHAPGLTWASGAE